jgi:hypothetical protein
MALISLEDIGQAVTELDRYARSGLRGIRMCIATDDARLKEPLKPNLTPLGQRPGAGPRGPHPG